MVRWLLGLSLSVVALAGLARPELHRYEAVEPHMGTLVRITLYAPGEQAAKDAFRAAFDRIRHLDGVLSDYRPDSELNQITTATVGRAVRVSEDLFAVLSASQELAEATGGAFDITQGPVVRLWREARATARLPDSAALQDAARRSGFRKLHLDAGQRTVTFDMTGMALDVGAIGKGYAASEAIKVLGGLGVSERSGGGERRSRVQRGAPRAARLANRRPLGRDIARGARNAGADQRGRFHFGQ